MTVPLAVQVFSRVQAGASVGADEEMRRATLNAQNWAIKFPVLMKFWRQNSSIVRFRLQKSNAGHEIKISSKCVIINKF